MGVKLTKRKGFNFFRSYYDVYNELESKEDKIAFIEALLDRQFLGIKPTNLKGMAKFAYISQTNSIDSQVKGYEDKTGIILTPTAGGAVGGCYTPTAQVEEKVKEQVEVKEKVKLKIDSFLLSEIKISNDNNFFEFGNNKIEANENQIINFKTAVWFQKLFIKNLKEKEAPTIHQEKATYKNYVTPIRLMFDNDKVTQDQVKQAYEYLNSLEGEFWKKNILSTSTLREKISQILIQKNTGNGKQFTSTPKKPARFSIARAEQTLRTDAERKQREMENRNSGG